MSAFQSHRGMLSKLLVVAGLLCAVAGVVLSLGAVATSHPVSPAPGATVIAVALALVGLGRMCRPPGERATSRLRRR